LIVISILQGARNFWDSTAINDFPDSYGQEWTFEQRKALEKNVQACYFLGIVLTQMSNILINKTKKESLFSHGFRNLQMNASIVFTIGLAAFLINVPGLNNAFNMRPLKGLWYLPAIPFTLFIFWYAELRKFMCRRFKNSWYDEEFTW
jgi:sodium/potassium-transporting ATPase subunit alpha